MNHRTQHSCSGTYYRHGGQSSDSAVDDYQVLQR
jgi:hypothetical protein